MTRWMLALCMAQAAALGAAAQDFRAQVEADWQVQLANRYEGPKIPATRETDALGGCDGVKDGKWGFHTGGEANPWWQVDLGAETPLDRVLLWNRCDAPDRCNSVIVQTSSDGEKWSDAFTNNGTVFYGFTDGKPLAAPMGGAPARFVRVALRGETFLHLDEVEVFAQADPSVNIALRRPATQSGVSQWSVDHTQTAPPAPDLAEHLDRAVRRCHELIMTRAGEGLDVARLSKMLSRAERKIEKLAGTAPDAALFNEVRWIQRDLLLMDPLLNFDEILFAKRVPGSFNHMSDQHYGWFSRPGGGIYRMRGFREGAPELTCISAAFTEPGSFMRPSLSFDGTKVLFAWCKHYPGLSDHPDKLDKDNVPEDAFYHVYEMSLDGTGLRQLTRGKYDDFDARYLPDGRIIFLSTRRGQFVQAGADTAARTLEEPALPDCYVRCGGGPERPVAVYTLHTMEADGTGLNAISPFEMFEWTPSVAHDGSILYSRWDYVDRWNMPFMSLWSIHPDGTHTRIVYKNYTHSPHCTFEPQCVPGSNKIVFTGSAHHAQTMGSLALLDPTIGTEGADPIRRLTPEVVFPEIEGWPTTYYSSPWPLSERLYIVAWGLVPTPTYPQQRPDNDMGLYLYDADSGQLELLHRDAAFACEWPLPVAARPMPPALADTVRADAPKEGSFLVANVCEGLKTVKPGDIKALRVIAVPAKTHPTMDSPAMGIMKDDPGKCVLGTVPVEPDGSAHFRVPAGVTMFFQALDDRGVAVQTMRGAVHVQPGQTLSCVGCHEHRMSAPPAQAFAAARREPSRITPGPDGTWPFRYDRLVQPVLDTHCVSCHNPKAKDKRAARFRLTPEKSYEALCGYGKPSLVDNVREGYLRGYSIEGTGPASTSPVLALLDDPKGHHGVSLSPEERERLVIWLDAYGQRLGSFSGEQERQLEELKAGSAGLLAAKN